MGSEQASGKDIIIFGNFQGMNTQTDRHALPEDRPSWIENLQPVGPNNLKSVGSPAATLATLVGETITRKFFAPINGINYLICFCVSGAAYAVNLSTGGQIKFANSGTFSLSPDMTTWNQSRILIADPVSGYCTWDGTLFVQQGGVSPNIIITNGGMYSSTPTVTISGGSGTGATATAVLTGGVVTAVNLTNSGTGFKAGDTLTIAFSGGSPSAGSLTNLTLTNGGNGYTSIPTIGFTGGGGSGGAAQASVLVAGGPVASLTLTNPGSGYTSVPTVTFTGGAGSNAAATVGVTTLAAATVVVWPFISPNPTTIAVFQGRVFMAQKNVITYTGIQGYSDVNPSNAAGTFIVTDSDLITQITALRTLNNYLYVVGDNSVKQIGNLSISGSITTFSLVTLSSDQGTIFQSTVLSFNRLMIFANTVGAYAVFGSSVDKISDDMDGIFQNIDFTQQLCGAVNDINNIHSLLFLVRYKDPFSTTRSIILGQTNKKWFVMSQGNSLRYISTCVIGGVTETFATSGSDITQIIQNTTTPISITLKTALSVHGKPYMGKNSLRSAVSQTSGASGNSFNLLVESENGNFSIPYQPTGALITFVNNSGQTLQFQNNSFQNINFETNNVFSYLGNLRGPSAQNVQGIYLGLTLTGEATDYSLNTLMLEYKETALFGVNG